MKDVRFATAALTVAAIALTGFVASAVSNTQPQAATAPQSARVARGEFLVSIMGCHDCHTPWKVGPNGPEMDMSRALTGHPQDLKMPPGPAIPPGPWMATAAATMTAWSGPWGTSFTMNLTPDKDTGLGDWTEEQFIATMRTGKDRGKGRALLPPMPWFNLNKLSDEDLKSVFAYLQSLKPVRNRIPAPLDPSEGAKQ